MEVFVVTLSIHNLGD